MESSWENKLIVASIDFGTAFSGLTISLRKDITMNDGSKTRTIIPTWKSGHQVGTAKTPTVLLLNPDKQFDSFGYDAENRFAELADEDNHKDWLYFRHFKMKLYGNKKEQPIGLKSKIMDEHGRKFDAIEVFKYSIKFMKSEVEKIISDRLPAHPLNDIYYVLTCPAIWTEQSKQFMRAAAKSAGIPGDHLRIALEPECAAVYIHAEELPDLSASSRGAFPMLPGLCYLIVDMGGGTVDIAAHTINNSNRIEEIMSPDGGPWGGVNINYKFEQFIVGLSGAEAFMKFKEENMDDYLGLMRAFEIKKCAFTIDKDSKVTLSIPTSYREVHNELNEELDRSLKESRFSDTVVRKKDKLSMDKHVFADFFNGTIEKIVEKVKSVLESIGQPVPTIFCVGGFSDCPLVKKRLKEAFPDKRIVTPPDAVAAIMKGAAIYARDENIIEKRVCKYTIGLDWNEDFNDKLHPLEKRESVDDGYVCRDIFRKIVGKGDRIMTGKPVHEVRSYVKMKNQDIMDFPFYRSYAYECPKFIDDPGCFHVGSMSVSLEDLSGGLDRYVNLKVYVDKMLHAEAEDEKGRKRQVTLNIEETQF